jgi:hypothetical protein
MFGLFFTSLVITVIYDFQKRKTDSMIYRINIIFILNYVKYL